MHVPLDVGLFSVNLLYLELLTGVFYKEIPVLRVANLISFHKMLPYQQLISLAGFQTGKDHLSTYKAIKSK